MYNFYVINLAFDECGSQCKFVDTHKKSGIMLEKRDVIDVQPCIVGYDTYGVMLTYYDNYGSIANMSFGKAWFKHNAEDAAKRIRKALDLHDTPRYRTNNSVIVIQSNGENDYERTMREMRELRETEEAAAKVIVCGAVFLGACVGELINKLSSNDKHKTKKKK